MLHAELIPVYAVSSETAEVIPFTTDVRAK